MANRILAPVVGQTYVDCLGRNVELTAIERPGYFTIRDTDNRFRQDGTALTLWDSKPTNEEFDEAMAAIGAWGEAR